VKTARPALNTFESATVQLPGRARFVVVSRGGAPLSSNIARKVVQSFEHKGLSLEDQASLTKREEEILRGVVRGLINKEIADELGISVETIRVHLKNIYEKLHVRSRTEAALKAYPLSGRTGVEVSSSSPSRFR